MNNRPLDDPNPSIIHHNNVTPNLLPIGALLILVLLGTVNIMGSVFEVLGLALKADHYVLFWAASFIRIIIVASLAYFMSVNIWARINAGKFNQRRQMTVFIILIVLILCLYLLAKYLINLYYVQRDYIPEFWYPIGFLEFKKIAQPLLSILEFGVIIFALTRKK